MLQELQNLNVTGELIALVLALTILYAVRTGLALLKDQVLPMARNHLVHIEQAFLNLTTTLSHIDKSLAHLSDEVEHLDRDFDKHVQVHDKE